ncbi:MAG: class II aldolase [Deltaproteobacteria bacterium]|nr:MAG: class II aldolase [Deltaproteobacteria bacterium]
MDPYIQVRKEIIECCQWLSRHGYFGSQLSAGGNVSVRLADADALAITPSAKPYMDLKPADICVIDLDLNPIDGALKPSIETGMHAGIYRQRADVGAVVHTHQPYASILSLINQPIPALFDEVCMTIGETVDVIPYAFSGTQELADHVRRSVTNGCQCFIMQNHGALSLGKKLAEAWKNSELLEKCARVYHMALATGRAVNALPQSALEWITAMRAQTIRNEDERDNVK